MTNRASLIAIPKTKDPAASSSGLTPCSVAGKEQAARPSSMSVYQGKSMPSGGEGGIVRTLSKTERYQ